MNQLSRTWVRGEQLLLLMITLVGVGSSLVYFLARDSLWEDEIIAVTHLLQPLPSFFVQILRTDVHPFAYFLFLKLWSLPAFGSDTWLLASSYISLLASTAAIAWVARRVASGRAAVWAVALFCVLPNFAWAGANLRMYALTPGLVVLLWFSWREFLLRGGRGMWMLGIGTQFVLVYTHAIQFFFVFFVLLAVSIEARGASRENWRRGLLSQVGVWVLTLPVIGSTLLRGAEPLPSTTLNYAATLPGQLFSGWETNNDPLFVAAGTLIAGGLVLAALQARSLRATLLVAVVLPLVFAGAVGAVWKPLFKPPVFTASLVPLLVLCAGSGMAAVQSAAFVRAMLALAVLLAGATVPWARVLLPEENYRPAAEFVRGQVAAGDVVIVPRNSVFWGVMRYSGEPRWGRPLEVMPPSNPAWTRLKERLGSHLSEAIGLNPRGQTVVVNGIRYVFADQPAAFVSDAVRVWVVHRRWYRYELDYGRPLRVAETRWFGREISVSVLVPDAAGLSRHSNPPVLDQRTQSAD